MVARATSSKIKSSVNMGVGSKRSSRVTSHLRTTITALSSAGADLETIIGQPSKDSDEENFRSGAALSEAGRRNAITSPSKVIGINQDEKKPAII